MAQIVQEIFAPPLYEPDRRLELQRLYLEYPRHVHVETIGMCNARCSCCPNAISPRRREKMSDELFTKIVQDLKEIPRGLRFAVSPFKLNEPLLDPKIFVRMETLARELPNVQLWLTTNLNLADETLLERLSQVPKIGYVWVSLHTLDEAEYRQWMGLSLPKTVANIRRLLQMNRQHQFTPVIVLGRVGDGSDGDARFLDDVQRVFAEFEFTRDYEVGITRRGQWMGSYNGGSEAIPDTTCERWFELSITCTGEVAFCCMDGLCKWPLGDVREKTILEIYNQPAYYELRLQCPPRRAVEPCVGCSY